MNTAEQDVLEENDFAEEFLVRKPEGQSHHMVQIGANEGKFEYAKVTGKDFVFDFLQDNTNWSALLIEPIPPVFETLKQNYSGHGNALFFLNCAITETLEERVLTLRGADGKASSLVSGTQGARHAPTPGMQETVQVPCLTFDFACRLVNRPAVDFLKIDAEGYDETIVMSVLRGPSASLPRMIMWEQTGPERQNCSVTLVERDYRVFRTGLTKSGHYLDRVAIHRSLL